MFDTDKTRTLLLYYRTMDARMGDLINEVKKVDKDLYNRLLSAWIDQGNAFRDLMFTIKEEKEES